MGINWTFTRYCLGYYTAETIQNHLRWQTFCQNISNTIHDPEISEWHGVYINGYSETFYMCGQRQRHATPSTPLARYQCFVKTIAGEHLEHYRHRHLNLATVTYSILYPESQKVVMVLDHCTVYEITISLMDRQYFLGIISLPQLRAATFDYHRNYETL